MNLYVGGAGQGKTEYVLQKLQAEPVVIPGEDLDDWMQKTQKNGNTVIPKPAIAFQGEQREYHLNQAVVVTHLEVYIRKLQGRARNVQADDSADQKESAETVVTAGNSHPDEDPEISFSATICNQLDALMQRYPDISFICNEIGNGIVPMDPEERLWREVTGRVLIHLAREADHFERVIAGMGQVIK